MIPFDLEKARAGAKLQDAAGDAVAFFAYDALRNICVVRFAEDENYFEYEEDGTSLEACPRLGMAPEEITLYLAKIQYTSGADWAAFTSEEERTSYLEDLGSARLLRTFEASIHLPE